MLKENPYIFDKLFVKWNNLSFQTLLCSYKIADSSETTEVMNINDFFADADGSGDEDLDSLTGDDHVSTGLRKTSKSVGVTSDELIRGRTTDQTHEEPQQLETDESEDDSSGSLQRPTFERGQSSRDISINMPLSQFYNLQRQSVTGSPQHSSESQPSPNVKSKHGFTRLGSSANRPPSTAAEVIQGKNGPSRAEHVIQLSNHRPDDQRAAEVTQTKKGPNRAEHLTQRSNHRPDDEREAEVTQSKKGPNRAKHVTQRSNHRSIGQGNRSEMTSNCRTSPQASGGRRRADSRRTLSPSPVDTQPQKRNMTRYRNVSIILYTLTIFLKSVNSMIVVFVAFRYLHPVLESAYSNDHCLLKVNRIAQTVRIIP